MANGGVKWKDVLSKAALPTSSLSTQNYYLISLLACEVGGRTAGGTPCVSMSVSVLWNFDFSQ